MTASDTDLQNACLDMARAAKWSRTPYDATLLSSLATSLEAIARGFKADSPDRDLPLITNAVRYLTQVHALPLMNDDTTWFYNMLSVVIEIARPNTIVDDYGKPFLQKMKMGLDQLLRYEA